MVRHRWLIRQVDRLLNALDRIRNHPFEPRIIPEVDVYFKQLSARFPGKLVAAFADISAAIQDEKFSSNLKATIPQLYALTRNTCAVTRLSGSDKVNVLPASATAEVDCRLLPDQQADEFLQRLQNIVADPMISIAPTLVLTPATSSIDTELYVAIESVLKQYYPDADVGPSVSTGFTDSHHLRKRGIISYGFTPAVIPLSDYGGIHGNNERLSVENMQEGTEVLTTIVRQLTY